MIKEIKGTSLVTVCDNCGLEKINNMVGVIMRKNEFNEYDNLVVPCECGSGEVFNMNIPVNDTDEQFMTDDLEAKEEVKRYYVRVLQRLIRDDFMSAK
ncbi:hypothetical protein [Oceanobacillus sp. CF4.6]|uniref:hypothetical protein n=1 Tax=Oceanobacillus sp. CF4.6 TaxID=3373080 RepID=UPI003EE60754